MGVLFLLGNGFDKGCGLKCSYPEIYKEYIKSESSTPTIENIKKDILFDVTTWADYEMGLAKYAKKLESGEQLQECVRDMKSFLHNYLASEQEQFFKRVSTPEVKQAIRSEILRSFREYYSDITPNISKIVENNNRIDGKDDVNIITFNYTNLVDGLLSLIKEAYGFAQFGEIIHIHGSIDNKDITLGIDNESQLTVDYFLSKKNKRAIIKPYYNMEIDKHRLENAQKLIYSSQNICCFGLSLGDSDKMWRDQLINELKENEDMQLFIYQYDLFDYEYVSKDEMLDIGEERAENLLKQWGVVDSESLLSRIHVPCGKHIFDIDGAISRGIEKELESRPTM